MWFKKFGWAENPFSLTPTYKVVDLENEKKAVIAGVDANQILHVTGDTGYGKTSLLLWLRRTLSRTNKFLTPVRMNGVRIDSKEVFLLTLKKRRHFFDRLFFRAFPKNLVVLMDEVQHFPSEVLELARIFWDEKIIRSLVLASTEECPQNLSRHFKDRISRIVKLPSLKRGELVDMIKIRADNRTPFDLDAMISIIEFSHNIPRRVLEACADICQWAADNNISNVDVRAVKRWLEKREQRGRAEERTTEQKITKPTKQREQLPEQKELILLQKIPLSDMQQQIRTAILSGTDTVPQISKSLNLNDDVVRIQLKRMIKKGFVKCLNTRPKKYVTISEPAPEQRPTLKTTSPDDVEKEIILVLKKHNAITGKQAIEKAVVLQEVQNAIPVPSSMIDDVVLQLINQGKVASIEKKLFFIALDNPEQTPFQ